MQPGELVLAASEKDIPPIEAREEYFVPAQKADLEDGDLVVGFLIGGKSRTYPVRLLSLHEVVNDQIGDTSFAVTWSPLCFSPVVYNRIVEGQELSFRASGYLLNDNLVLLDHPTNTLWSQLLGQGIKGAYRDTYLEIFPSSLTTWKIWRELHPDTQVLSAEKLGYPGGVPDPYGGYFASGARGLGGSEEIDARLPGKTLVLGLRVGESTAAVPLDALEEKRIAAINLEPVSLVGIFDEISGQGYFYISEVNGMALSFEQVTGGRQVRDHQTGSLWNPAAGLAVKGELRGSQLVRYPSQLAYWFAWSSFYPDTAVLP